MSTKPLPTQLLLVGSLGLACLLGCIWLGLVLGATPLSTADLLAVFSGENSTAKQIILHLRLPRVLMAMQAGAILALGGLVLQTILRNPLAEPYILGISGGAAVGAILGVLGGLSSFLSNSLALIGALSTLGLVTILGFKRTESLLLAGVMLNAFCGAMILFLISLASSTELSSIMFWFMGNLAACSLSEALNYALILIPGIIGLSFIGHTLNLLSLGNEAAQSLGLAVRPVVLGLLVVLSLLVCVIVTAVGPLGFVGLVIPQILRLTLGHDLRLIAPACALFGASFLILADLLARTLPSQGELPAGVITALIGAPLFILLQYRSKA